MATVGDVLAGRYELRSLLGRGGMAEVFRATDTRLGREVAVKVLAGHLLSDPRSVERFQREGRTAAALNHPNIVDVYDAASEGDTHFIVMELVEGPTLAQVLAREGRMPVERALDIAGRIAGALEVAHERGLVHHDIKPSNVLFDPDGNVKVTDFGIARAASSDITTVQGSPPYVAPEQAKGGRADPRSDVYGLGCVLFEMLTGRPPFVADTPSAVIMHHLETPAPSVSELRDDVPGHVVDLVARALAKEPAHRYESAQAFRADIERVAAGQAPTAGATIVSTRHLEQGPTVPLSRGQTRQFEPPREPTQAFGRHHGRETAARRRRGWVRPGLQTVTVLVLLILLAGLAYAAMNDDRLREQPERDVAQEQNDPPDEDAGRDDRDRADDRSDKKKSRDESDDDRSGSVGRAAEQIRGLLERGRDADEATDRAVEQLQKELEKALSEQIEGDTDKAADRIERIRRRLDRLNERREIGSDLADQMRRMLDDVSPFSG